MIREISLNSSPFHCRSFSGASSTVVLILIEEEDSSLGKIQISQFLIKQSGKKKINYFYGSNSMRKLI